MSCYIIQEHPLPPISHSEGVLWNFTTYNPQEYEKEALRKRLYNYANYLLRIVYFLPITPFLTLLGIIFQRLSECSFVLV